MPVPSYNVIADSEIDPESPITSSLMFRLRDNWLAVFGIDNTNPSPATPIANSRAVKEYTSIGTEHYITKLTEGGEEYHVIDGVSPAANLAWTSSWSGHMPLTCVWLWIYNNGGLPEYAGNLSGIEAHVTYAASVPTSVNFAYMVNGALTTLNVTPTNTWQTMMTASDGSTFQVKVRSVVDGLMVQYREVQANTPWGTNFFGGAGVRVRQVSKA